MNDDLLELLKVKKLPQDNIKHNFLLKHKNYQIL